MKQAIGFFGLSGIGWILDFCTYTLLGFISKNVVANNYISSWVGVTFVFIFATRKVFINNSKISLKWKYVIYILYQVVLILLISQLLGLINHYVILLFSTMINEQAAAIMSKIIVTPVTMILNFCVMKGVIERL